MGLLRGMGRGLGEEIWADHVDLKYGMGSEESARNLPESMGLCLTKRSSASAASPVDPFRFLQRPPESREEVDRASTQTRLEAKSTRGEQNVGACRTGRLHQMPVQRDKTSTARTRHSKHYAFQYKRYLGVLLCVHHTSDVYEFA